MKAFDGDKSEYSSQGIPYIDMWSTFYYFQHFLNQISDFVSKSTVLWIVLNPQWFGSFVSLIENFVINFFTILS